MVRKRSHQAHQVHKAHKAHSRLTSTQSTDGQTALYHRTHRQRAWFDTNLSVTGGNLRLEKGTSMKLNLTEATNGQQGKTASEKLAATGIQNIVGGEK